jgi:hypothetical protein
LAAPGIESRLGQLTTIASAAAVHRSHQVLGFGPWLRARVLVLVLARVLLLVFKIFSLKARFEFSFVQILDCIGRWLDKVVQIPANPRRFVQILDNRRPMPAAVLSPSIDQLDDVVSPTSLADPEYACQHGRRAPDCRTPVLA